MRLGISLACEMSIRRVARGCCSFPLRSSVRSKRIELSLLLRNLVHTLTVRNPEFPFAESVRRTSRGDSGRKTSAGSSSHGPKNNGMPSFGKTKRIGRPTRDGS